MKTKPARFSSEPERIESTRRRNTDDETPLMAPLIQGRNGSQTRPSPAQIPLSPRAEAEAARRRIEQLEVVLRESRAEGQRLQLEVRALQRLSPAPPPMKKAPPLWAPISALVIGTCVGIAGGVQFAAIVAGLGAFSAILFAQWLAGRRLDS